MLTKQQACFQGHVTRKEHGALLRNSADSGETDSNLAKACCFTSFTSLGQQKQQVFMYICYILWQSLLILATCLKYPLTNVIVIEACKYGSHKCTPLAFWDYFIIHFFYHLQQLALSCLSYLDSWVYTCRVKERNFPVSISQLLVLSHCNFTVI